MEAMELRKKLLFDISPGLNEREILGNSVDCQGSLQFGAYEEKGYNSGAKG